MTLDEEPEAYGYTIFCDDIRVEIGGKLTYVGVYTGPMLVPTFPFTLQKLALSIVYFQKRQNIVPFQLLVFLPHDAEERPSATFGTDENEFWAAIGTAEDVAITSGREPVYATAHLQLTLNGLNLVQPGNIRVRATRADKLIRLGILQVMLQRPVEAPPT
jgi:hypothetical protein